MFYFIFLLIIKCKSIVCQEQKKRWSPSWTTMKCSDVSNVWIGQYFNTYILMEFSFRNIWRSLCLSKERLKCKLVNYIQLMLFLSSSIHFHTFIKTLWFYHLWKQSHLSTSMFNIGQFLLTQVFSGQGLPPDLLDLLLFSFAENDSGSSE